MKNLLMVLLVFIAATSLYATGELYVEDGSSHSTRDWTLESAQAVSVFEDGLGGGGGGGLPHPNYGDTEDFTTFWFKGEGFKLVGGVPTANWLFPIYKRTDFADNLGGDLSMYMDMAVKLRMRSNDWYHTIISFYADINHIQFIFDGTVGGVAKQAIFKTYLGGYGWAFEVWNDMEVQLDNGLFTMTGSTVPSGWTGLQVQNTFDAGDALEFWQNITGMRIYMQVQAWTSNPALCTDNWFDIEYLYFVPPIPTTCEHAILQGYGTAGDLNEDCEVNFEDVALLATAWLNCIAPEADECSHQWLE